MPYVRDAFDDVDDYDRGQEREEKAWLNKLPRCCCCGEPIRSEKCWTIGGEIYCEECINDGEDYTENHMRG